MADVTLFITAKRTMEIGQELRASGWVQGVDFDYAYYKEEYDNFTYTSNFDPLRSRRAVFTWYNDSNASYFMLRYG